MLSPQAATSAEKEVLLATHVDSLCSLCVHGFLLFLYICYAHARPESKIYLGFTYIFAAHMLFAAHMYKGSSPFFFLQLSLSRRTHILNSTPFANRNVSHILKSVI